MAEKMQDDKITDQATYLNRRTFMRVAALAGTATATTFLYRRLNPPPPVPVEGEKLNDVAKAATDANGFTTSEQKTAIAKHCAITVSSLKLTWIWVCCC